MARHDDILAFWFGAPEAPDCCQPREAWFKKNDAFDADIRERFLAVRPAWRNLVLSSGQRLRFADVVRAGTDFGGLLNPLSRVYTKHSARRLFSGLANFRFVTQFNYFRALEENPSLLVRAVRRAMAWFDRRWGWFLIVHAEKP